MACEKFLLSIIAYVCICEIDFLNGALMNIKEYRIINVMNEKRLEIQKEYYNRLREIDKETRKFRHDIQNHVQLQLMIFINTE